MSASGLPFTRAQFFEVFALYNLETWPAALLAYPVAALAVASAFRGGVQASRAAGLLLAVIWAWVGVAYHGLYFSQINSAALIFGAAFVLQALLFAVGAIRACGLEFDRRSPVRAVTGAALIFYAAVAYPLTGILVGERYPALPLFVTAPCPLLIFTFGLYVWASTVRWWLWIVPLAWSVIGGSAVMLLGVPQDWALLPSAALALAVALVGRGRRKALEMVRDGQR